jgi:hypothetical protein
VIGALRPSAMIAAVTLRLLYLIFQQVLGLVLQPMCWALADGDGFSRRSRRSSRR